MVKLVKIAVAQIRYFDTAEKHNVAKIKRYISLAKRSGAEIVCFPESCIHKSDYLEISHELVKKIQESCKKNSIWAIVTDSFLINKKPYKMSLLINRNGEIKGKYKKINLYDDYLNPGKKIGIFKTDFAKIGIVICWDLHSPILFTKMKEKNVKIVFCPSFWAYEKKVHKSFGRKKEMFLLKSLIASRAYENFYFIALANPVLPERNDLVSYSAIVSPHKVLKEIKNKEGLIVSEINLDELKRWKKIYPNKKRYYSQ
jgi:predicted amidohydrolase